MLSEFFGIELEVIGTPGLRTRIQEALNVAGVAVGSSLMRYTPGGQSTWVLKYDGSIHSSPARPGYTEGVELVSPKMSSDNPEHWEQVRKACLALQSAGAEVNSSCGFHVHVNARGMSNGQFKNLIKLYAKFEPVIDQMMPASRRGRTNNYCQSLLNQPSGVEVKVAVQQFFTLIDNTHTIRGLQRKLMRHSPSHAERYYKVNLHAFSVHETVEFRQHSGTVDAAKVENWVKMCLAMVARSRKPKTRVLVDGAGDFDTFFKAVGDKELKVFYRNRIAALNAGAAE